MIGKLQWLSYAFTLIGVACLWLLLGFVLHVMRAPWWVWTPYSVMIGCFIVAELIEHIKNGLIE